jgi:hypothetical protein
MRPSGLRSPWGRSKCINRVVMGEFVGFKLYVFRINRLRSHESSMIRDSKNKNYLSTKLRKKNKKVMIGGDKGMANLKTNWQVLFSYNSTFK